MRGAWRFFRSRPRGILAAISLIGLSVPVIPVHAATTGAGAPLLPAPGDPLSAWQWDMTQIGAFGAQAITPGSRAVIAGDIDTGIDPTHPDLAPNFDAADSAGCLTGKPDTNFVDDNGHGTHTAGTIAAARNGIGIVGVAPNV